MYVGSMFSSPCILLMAVLQGAYHVTVYEAWQCHAGKVRKECVEGLRRVVGLRRVEWARQVDSFNLLPTCLMLDLLDKKFGGELTKEDVQVRSTCMLSVSRERIWFRHHVPTVDCMTASACMSGLGN